MNHFFFYTTDLDNTKSKSKLNKYKEEPCLVFGDQIWETEKVKKKKIYKYVYINIVYNIF